MRALLSRLGDLARLGLGRYEFRPAELNLVDVISAVTARLDPADAARIRVETDGEEPIGIWDRVALEQVPSNLVSNALKYSQMLGLCPNECVDWRGARR